MTTFTKFNSGSYKWICEPIFIRGLPIFYFNIAILITGTYIDNKDHFTILSINRQQITRDLGYTNGEKIK